MFNIKAALATIFLRKTSQWIVEKKTDLSLICDFKTNTTYFKIHSLPIAAKMGYQYLFAHNQHLEHINLVNE